MGSNWDPPVNQVTIDGAIDALIEYRNLTDGVTDYHIELLEERWGEIIDELRPRGFMELPTPSIDSDAVYIVEALWDIYDREKYDYHDSSAWDIRRTARDLIDEREALEVQYNSLDPRQLQDSIKATALPIICSVIFPLLVRFLTDWHDNWG